VYEREIRFDVVGDSTGVWDRDRVSQLLSNLIANACQHGTPQTPVGIHIDGSAIGVVTLEIHNQGAVSPALLPVVFEPLRRSGQRREKHKGPSGLGRGLYITQQVIVAHGGTIDVESSEREGTRFVVRLPRQPSNVASGPSEGGDRTGTGVFDAGGPPSSPPPV
jgi:signal transduction histidine kinase